MDKKEVLVYWRRIEKSAARDIQVSPVQISNVTRKLPTVLCSSQEW